MDDKERLLRDLYHLKTEKEELSESIQMKEVTMEHLQESLQSAVAEVYLFFIKYQIVVSQKENICSRMDKLSTDLKEAISDVDSYRNDLLKKEESYKVLKSDYSTVKVSFITKFNIIQPQF